jgi:formylglycine-generating enzyme required for sulfatase activity
MPRAWPLLLALAVLPRGAVRADGDDVVLVPEGAFQSGCNEAVDRDCFDSEKPARTLYFKAFHVDRTEVTVVAYAACVDAGACTPAGDEEGCLAGSFFGGSYPVNCVDLAQAKAFCAWKGRRLPTAHEWEKAARGTDGRRFPWGNDAGDPAPAVLLPSEAPAEVGSLPAGASPFGALDMAGNVAEWTSSPWDAKRYEVRGGGFTSSVRHARSSSRLGEPATSRKAWLGFRCVR